MKSEHKCVGRIWTGFSHNACGRGAAYEHEGEHYCKTHHPPAVGARATARNTEYEEQYRLRKEMADAEKDRAKERERRAAAFPLLVEALEKVSSDLGCIVGEHAADSLVLHELRIVVKKALEVVR